MSTKIPQLPVKEFRLGAIKIAVWENEAEGHKFCKSTISHLYRVPDHDRESGDSGWRETSSFGADDLVLIRELVRRVGQWIHTQEGLASDDAKPHV